ncbi:UDP-N-acetylglucosamine--N-acetylmuramyl-(pentapeptide) pyrophosphoryl-undecaprenol N-acetylglucosamine transferase [Rickettsiales endosymbiont of Stachyamoeba lipophora]|uniref:UDP-N-acetylglucosamine--N-acetylmuramyl- (pentapeptide) pyrophosphoryl-undecaprenol N-acetylglucosamine transferase n=1 Tax=Rickettsiales endosymbiont of Stachyamoeba lipophora TaxID=2486578 RepID=UPI000F653AAE|nr:UDP-N-acetylglucosamine--N-acetylmuramyl-(pentapeptide) pyrophosphoryl-undecaprenol N-acetylglucosamine transferase [Rickettsiales endosymbiont of Stachyamoeba lipophora]AZL15458.1 UDP-N-acetylglucosamine--N-acetylmuramyl-(pentapeptide) pyrophosphoryl-undecaprenol N-acetylglucosamine transferase [Rickettsiales endosymbiont of Stachyamoeba lipophora]
MNEEYLIVAGGTGGHVSPAIAVYEELVAQHKKLKFITDERCVKYFKHTDIQPVIINIRPFTKSLIGVYKFAASLYLALFKLIWLLINNKNLRTIIVFGGYPCLPAILAGSILGRKIVVHEQNAVMGRMNRFAAIFAKEIWLGFQDTKLVPKNAIHKTKYIGVPVRKQILNVEISNNSNNKQFTILIVGGSQGASAFAEIIPTTIKSLENTTKKIIIYQQCRDEEEKEKLEEFYRTYKITAQIEIYFYNIEQKMAAADIVIARSGASTISELIALEKPSILIPLPSSMDDHQYYNALTLAEQKAAILLNQNEAKASLANCLNRLVGNPEELLEIKQSLQKIKLANLVGIREVLKSI